ncbi:MAG: hypothetical protein GC200_10750 [Tepidisphaera sp.]|nr:hypothetical protein [Tepidisphaera sp.]
MTRAVTPLALFPLLALLSGCVNSWQSGYVASSSLAPAAPASGPIELRGMPAEDVLKAPPPDGCERIGYSEFVSSAGPELDRLQEFGQKLGATTIYWGRTFAQLSQETDYRADYYPSTSTTTITSPDGSKTTVHTNDGGTQYVPHVRTDAWYRYVAAFYRKRP